MYNIKKEPIDNLSAKSIAIKWIDSRIDKPISHMVSSQVRWIVIELSEKCISESISLNEDEDQFLERLDYVYDIVNSAWYHLTLKYKSGENLGQPDKVTIEKQNDVIKHRLWIRHDPKISFEEGTKSESYIDFDKNELNLVIAKYMSKAYLRHPVLDWIFVDATISRELSIFGEYLKMYFLPGKYDPILKIHSRYIKCSGRLDQMQKLDWIETLGQFIIGISLFFVSMLLIAVCFYYKNWILIICVIYLSIVVKSLSYYRQVIIKNNTYKRLCKLWNKMYEVWTQLEGPIINPTLVREAMINSRNQGAVWDIASYSLIDRTINIDPAAWIIEASLM